MQPPRGFISQGLEIANLESVGRVVAQQLTCQPVDDAEVLLAAHRPLGIHRILFLVDVGGVQQRVGEKTREAIQCLRKRVVLNHHHVIGDIEAGVGIGHAAVLGGEGHKAIGFGELGGPHKQHVLEIVGHPGIILGV